jgi:chemotaxis protein CheZ
MAAAEAAQKIRIAMDQLKATGVRERPLVEVLDLSHQLADAMTVFFRSLDRSIIAEFKYLADFIQKARDEISGLQANDIKDTRLPGASVELDAVVRDTERATETIMTEAEKLMSVEPTDLAAYKAEVNAAMMRIFEACSFQDLTGQRVTKVISTLRHIEERVARFAGALGVTDTAQAETADEVRARELLLNGPAMNGPSTSQDDIDALFP